MSSLNIQADLHMHTIASTHAYSTAQEMARGAYESGLSLIALTDHGIGMPDAPHIWHFGNLDNLPRRMEGTFVLRGVEANLIDLSGKVDMPETILKKLDLAIVSVHGGMVTPGTVEENTAAYCAALANPYLDILGHSGNPNFLYDLDQVIGIAKEYNKIIEINEHSFSIRPANAKRCVEIAKKCKEYGVWIAVNTDAHISYDIGKIPLSSQMLAQIDFPKERIINLHADRVMEYLNARPMRDAICE